jgi:hypothetical protein
MVKLSVWAREEHQVPIQRVVKRYDLRFGNNPAAFIANGCNGALVEITYEGTDPERPRGWFRRLWMRIFG